MSKDIVTSKVLYHYEDKFSKLGKTSKSLFVVSKEHQRLLIKAHSSFRTSCLSCNRLSRMLVSVMFPGVTLKSCFILAS